MYCIETIWWRTVRPWKKVRIHPIKEDVYLNGIGLWGFILGVSARLVSAIIL
jgi:hypothetical protein